MKLFIKVLNDKARKYYESHERFHSGDAGLDLYILEDIKFDPGETKMIKLEETYILHKNRMNQV